MKNTDFFFCISHVFNINDTILQRYKSVVEFDIDNDLEYLDERLYTIIKLKNIFIYIYKNSYYLCFSIVNDTFTESTRINNITKHYNFDLSIIEAIYEYICIHYL